MRDKINQNDYSQKPSLECFTNSKYPSLLINCKLVFPKATLLYWFILTLDSIAIIVAVMIATYIAKGGVNTQLLLWI